MTSPYSKRESAFTLIEMAIVIVIIGLLLGGVLAGQSLITSSKLNAVASQGQELIAGINAFRSQYSALPGDFSRATAYWNDAHADGNNNGEYNSADERFGAWQHLALAGMIPGQFTGQTGPDNAVHVVPGENAPETAVSKVSFFPSYVALSSPSGDRYGFAYKNNLSLGDVDAQGANAAVFTPEEAKKIDEKADDGKPGTGQYMANRRDGSWLCATTTDRFTAEYNVSNDARMCYFRILLGI